MNLLVAWVELPIVANIGMTLIHFLWQGLAIYLGYKLILSVFKPNSANVKYTLASIAMFSYLIAPIATFLQLNAAPVLTQSVVTNQDLIAAVMSEQQSLSINALFDAALPWLSLCWLVGVLYYSTKLAIELLKVNDLTKVQVAPVNAQVELAFYRLLAGMQIKVPVKLLQSSIAPVPMVIGWLKPVILIPTASLLHLSEKQLSMIIAHELAHVKRYDYLVNLIQSLVEVLMFFHPVVRLTSEDMREQREHICDDIAAAYFNDPIGYARALTETEALRSEASSLVAVAIDGGNLTARVSRVAGIDHHENSRTNRWLAGIISILSSCCIMAAIQVQANQRPITLDEVVKPFNATPVAEPASVSNVNTKANTKAATKTQTESRQAIANLQSAPLNEALLNEAPHNEALLSSANAKQVTPKPAAINRQSVEQANRQIIKPEVLSIRRSINEPAQASKAQSIQPVVIKSVAALPIDNSLEITPTKPAFIAPEVISAPMPAYPKFARRKQIEADINVTYTINSDGSVSINSLEHRYARYFKSAIQDSMAKWRFSPARKDGKAVAVQSEKTFNFRIFGDFEAAPVQTGTRIRLVEQDQATIKLPAQTAEIALPEVDVKLAQVQSEQVNEPTATPEPKEQLQQLPKEQATPEKLVVNNKQCRSIRMTGSRVGRNTCNHKQLGIKKIQLAAKN
jgi:bla regulator protein blaR1